MDKKPEDQKPTKSQDEKPSQDRVKRPAQKVSQKDFAKSLRQAILQAGLREGFRMGVKAMMDTLFGVEIDVEPQEQNLPEVDDLFDDVEVIEPSEHADPE